MNSPRSAVEADLAAAKEIIASAMANFKERTGFDIKVEASTEKWRGGVIVSVVGFRADFQ